MSELSRKRALKDKNTFKGKELTKKVDFFLKGMYTGFLGPSKSKVINDFFKNTYFNAVLRILRIVPC